MVYMEGTDKERDIIGKVSRGSLSERSLEELDFPVAFETLENKKRYVNLYGINNLRGRQLSGNVQYYRYQRYGKCHKRKKCPDTSSFFFGYKNGEVFVETVDFTDPKYWWVYQYLMHKMEFVNCYTTGPRVGKARPLIEENNYLTTRTMKVISMRREDSLWRPFDKYKI